MLLIIAATSVLYLGFRDQLSLYIHPRYIVFTIAMTAIGLIMVLLSEISSEAKHEHNKQPILVVPIALLLGFSLFFPARSLTSATVAQRATDVGSLVVTSDAEPIDTLFAGSSRGLRIVDWLRILDANDTPSYYINKPARISGFIYDAKLGTDVVWLARFVVTCCAVDAQPIGIPVLLEDWQTQYSEDGWLEVEGEFRHTPTADGAQMVLNPTSVTKIEEPKYPYATN